TEELNTDIAESESELNLNRQLIKSFKLDNDSIVNHPSELKINALKKQRSKHDEAATIRIKDVVQVNTTEQRILANEIQLLEKELELYQEERKKLSKYATAPGVVNTVYIKEGEQVNAYTSLLSVNPLHPSTAVGYLV